MYLYRNELIAIHSYYKHLLMLLQTLNQVSLGFQVVTLGTVLLHIEIYFPSPYFVVHLQKRMGVVRDESYRKRKLFTIICFNDLGFSIKAENCFCPCWDFFHKWLISKAKIDVLHKLYNYPGYIIQ